VNLNLYAHDLGFLIIADNIYGEKCEMVSQPGDGIWEYVNKNGRLNTSYIVYCLTNPPKGFAPLNDERQAFLDFLNKANDRRHPRRVLRPEGWRDHAGISRGEVVSVPKKAGDVVVHGDVARAYLTIIGE
jgi:hypothetical protein